VFVECSTAGRNDAGVVVGTLVSLSCVRVHVFGAAAVRCGGAGAVRCRQQLLPGLLYCITSLLAQSFTAPSLRTCVILNTSRTVLHTQQSETLESINFFLFGKETIC